MPGTGILLNNEMDDFSAKPGVPNAYGLIGGEKNSIGPGKRMLSSMTPTIVFKDKKLFLATGSPGGSRITTSVLQVILNVIDHKMSIREATSAPRIHHQWLPDTLYVERKAEKDLEAGLRKKGYEVKRTGPDGKHAEPSEDRRAFSRSDRSQAPGRAGARVLIHKLRPEKQIAANLSFAVM